MSPALFEPEPRAVVGDDAYYNYRTTGPLARFLWIQIELLERTATSDLERLAVHRSAMTVIIEAMDRVNDSLAEMSEVFAASERAYLKLARSIAGFDGILRDVLELAPCSRGILGKTGGSPGWTSFR